MNRRRRGSERELMGSGISLVDVALTGVGLRTPLGRGVKENCEALAAGRSAIGQASSVVASSREIAPLCEVDFEPSKHPKYIEMALDAGHEALAGAGLPPVQVDALLIGTNTGPRGLRDWKLAGLEPPCETIDDDLAFSLASERIARELGLECPAITISTACSSGLGAVAHAWQMISTGAVDTALCIGVEEWWYSPQLGYQLISALSSTACSPWGVSDGMTMSEGAGALVLQRSDQAKGQGAAHLAWVVGVGQSCDAYHPSRPDVSAAGAVLAVDRALDLAGRSQVDLIAGHGSGTKAADLMERRLARRLSGRIQNSAGEYPPTFSAKNLHGHTVGASGAIELIELVLALRGEADLSSAAYLGEEDRVIEAGASWGGMKNTFAVGGLNCSVVVASEASEVRRATRLPVSIARAEGVSGGIAYANSESFPDSEYSNNELDALITRHMRTDSGRLAQIDSLSRSAARMIAGLIEVSGIDDIMARNDLGILLVSESGPSRMWQMFATMAEQGKELPGGFISNLPRHASVTNCCELFGMRGWSSAFYVSDLEQSGIEELAHAAISSCAAPALMVVEIEHRLDDGNLHSSTRVQTLRGSVMVASQLPV